MSWGGQRKWLGLLFDVVRRLKICLKKLLILKIPIKHYQTTKNLSAVARDRLKTKVVIRLFETDLILKHKFKVSTCLPRKIGLFALIYLIPPWWFLMIKPRLLFKKRAQFVLL